MKHLLLISFLLALNTSVFSSEMGNTLHYESVRYQEEGVSSGLLENIAALLNTQAKHIAKAAIELKAEKREVTVPNIKSKLSKL